MVAEALEAVLSLRTLVLALLVFSVAPGLVLRLLTLAYHRDDPRRAEMRAELHVVPRLERPFWVAEQLETVVFDALPSRVEWALTGRLIHRWKLGSGVESNRQHPDTFEIPTEDQKADVLPGDLVKLMFVMKDWGERMWVEVDKVDGDRFAGQLSNQPIGIPRLYADDRVRFRSEHIIDIKWADEDDNAA